ncbi:unnamed protein product [Discosporangium mesarthrocarpum]
MSAFIMRLVNYFASEVITKRLANSRTFQDFALRTHNRAFKEAEKVMKEGNRQVEETTSSIGDQFRRFQAALKEEIERDFGVGKGKKR